MIAQSKWIHGSGFNQTSCSLYPPIQRTIQAHLSRNSNSRAVVCPAKGISSEDDGKSSSIKRPGHIGAADRRGQGSSADAGQHKSRRGSSRASTDGSAASSKRHANAASGAHDNKSGRTRQAGSAASRPAQGSNGSRQQGPSRPAGEGGRGGRGGRGGGRGRGRGAGRGTQMLGTSGSNKDFQPKQLTAAIKAADSPEQLLQVVQQHAADFNHIHLSVAYTCTVKLCRRGVPLQQQPAAVQQFLQLLHGLAEQLQQQCGARELANIIWSCGRLGTATTAAVLLHVFLQDSNLQEAVPQALSNVLWSAATLELQLTPQQLQQLLQRFAAVVQQAEPQAISNILWAAATMQQQVAPQQLQQILQRFLEVLPQAKPQEVSNTLWALATMQQQVPPVQLQQMLQHFCQEVLPAAKPQDVSNTMWALAAMQQQMPQEMLHAVLQHFQEVLPQAAPQAVANTMWAMATMQQDVPQKRLQQLVQRFQELLPQANPQNIANTLWAVATMQQQVPPVQLQQLLLHFQQVLPQANPQHVANTLWAVATMQLQLSATVLLPMLQHLQKVLAGASPQDIANTLWACGKLQFAPLQLLLALEQHPQQLQAVLAAANPQDLANMAWAYVQLGYIGRLLPGALLQQAVELLKNSSHTGSFKLQELCNLCWSMAVLDMQQLVPQVLQLAAASTQLWDTAKSEALRQLYQVHLWLLDSQLPAPGQGLSGVLLQQQLEQCRASWEQQLAANVQKPVTDTQQSVLVAVQRLPAGTWQQQPESEGVTADGLFSIDIAATTASGVKVAIEVDGPTHFIQPGRTPDGRTLFRNRALAARGYMVISIPYWEWDALRGSEQKQQYLLAELQPVLQLAISQQPQQQPAGAAPAQPAPGARKRRVVRRPLY